MQANEFSLFDNLSNKFLYDWIKTIGKVFLITIFIQLMPVLIQARTVTKHLYLSDPSQALDQVDPVNRADGSSALRTELSTAPASITVLLLRSRSVKILTTGIFFTRHYLSGHPKINNTTVNIDKDNNGIFESSINLNDGHSYFLNGGVYTGAIIAADKPVWVEWNAGGKDDYSSRNAPIFPATWYSNIYCTPVPTLDNAGDGPKDTSAVLFYNSLNSSITINWTSGIPSGGSFFVIPAKPAFRFPVAYSMTAACKFVNPTGESFTEIEIVDSDSPGTGRNSGLTYDRLFYLIAEKKLTDYATIAWTPGGFDLEAPPGPDVNGNPIWVNPTSNTRVYVKYDENFHYKTLIE